MRSPDNLLRVVDHAACSGGAVACSAGAATAGCADAAGSWPVAGPPGPRAAFCARNALNCACSPASTVWKVGRFAASCCRQAFISSALINQANKTLAT